MILERKGSLNAIYFTVLGENKQKEIVKDIMRLIENQQVNLPFWFLFGYKYFGILEYKYGEKTVERLKQYNKIESDEFIDKLTQLVYGETIVSNHKIVNDIKNGIQQFINDFFELGYKEEAVVCDDLAFSGIKYLSNNISVYDSKNIYQAVEKVDINGMEEYLPIIAKKQHKFGMVYPWPGMNTAETELLARATKAAENIGFECVMLSDFGEVLDEEQKATDKIVEGDELDFVMTTHYESHKSVDSYYYHLLWNPPDIPLNVEYYDGKVIDNYIMNDDYLIYDFGGMSSHLKSILLNKPRTLDNASTFVGSFPKSAVMQPNLDNPKLFYCGMNWESVVENSNRHAGLFKLLDNTGKVKFYGPDIVKEWGGIRPWEGYKCYQYSVPFDGFSILKEINSCGICLAISSDSHRRVGSVTNRAYEACAAGAVIISDNNIFMEEYFKDSVLYITYNKQDPEDTYRQIMEKYQWIIDNKEKAIEKAKRSQQIFIDKFCMEKGILDVTKNHYKRFKTIEKDLFAQSEEKTVLVTYVLSTQDEEKIAGMLALVVRNICNQYYRNIVLNIICDKLIEDKVICMAEKLLCNVVVSGFELFDEKGVRCLTNGQAIQDSLSKIYHDYYIGIGEEEIWFYDHISTLVRTIEDEPEALGAYSGILSQDNKGIRRTFSFETLKPATVYLQLHPKRLPIAGQFLFTKEAESYVPQFVYSCLDGTEHAAFVNLLMFKYKKKIVFSKRMTCIWKYEDEIHTCKVIDFQRQLRFIKGLVKYDIPSSGLGGAETPQIDISRLILLIPSRKLIKLKIFRVLNRKLRYTPFDKMLRKMCDKINKEYVDIMQTIS